MILLVLTVVLNRVIKRVVIIKRTLFHGPNEPQKSGRELFQEVI